ncbi:MAG: beta-ketoacyl-[acyl-carrier-protein] synthase family protein [Nitrospirae bacterium]|nr:beta-ketoacyl-[acyl-carrier-protein] synthase family protein [Nitrospirota bacterium]
MKNGVVITGIGIVSPLKPSDDINAFWDALCSGKDAIRRSKLPMLNLERQWLMASIDMYSFENFISPENKFQVIAESALGMAIEDAAIHGHPNVGLSIGTVLGNVLYKEKRLMENTEGGKIRESLSFPALYLSERYNLNGSCMTISTACASGTDAIGVAARRIMAGEADIVIAGGVDVISDFALLGFHTLQALTEEKVRPFDKNRTGLAISEGAAFVVLESKKHAVQRGAKIYGKVMGYASRSDANHLTSPHREGRGLSDAINHALSEACISPNDVDYINAHGTGTVYNDLTETKAIKRVFSKTAYEIPVSSTKSMLGHSFGAAGAIEAICCLLSIKNKRIPPTINYRERDPECDLDYVPNVSRYHNVRIAMSLSAGFGGQNSAIVFGEA